MVLDDSASCGSRGIRLKSDDETKDLFVPARRSNAYTRLTGLLTRVALPGPPIHDNPCITARIGAFLDRRRHRRLPSVPRAVRSISSKRFCALSARPSGPRCNSAKSRSSCNYYGQVFDKVSTAEAALIRAGAWRRIR